jgi:glutathione reductase (NADPH)
MSDPAYDLIVIGSGTAAQVASARVRAAGWRFAVVDRRPFGGTCALRGCDPKKMLISGAEAIDAMRRMRGRGVEGEARIDWLELAAFKRTFTDPVPAKQEARYAERGIDAFHGRARFIGRDAVEVDGTVLTGRRVLIAAGARPVPLGIPGDEHVATSNRFLELETLPERIVLVGGGYIAADFSHIAARERGLKVRVKAEAVPGWYTARRLAESVYGYKTLVEEDTGRILGAHLVGPHADEVINLFGLAIRTASRPRT